ncbi:MAG: ribonuclease J [Sphingomonadaceae bacterium]|nr:ribonuclease J [Sphingomonadaceae bacterium]
MTTPKDELLFLALGGSNEIGMNVNLYGCQGKWVMVDLGITFANADYPGVELVLPDLEFIEERKSDLLGIVLTHGHEDHIGAVAYFAADLDVPLYATPFTATLIRGKLVEEGIDDLVELKVIPMEGRFELGPFGFRFVTLAHSILEMSACVIDTPYGRVFHTGDWKLDEEPVIGTPSTAEQLTAIGDEGVLALVCDSTNAFNSTDSGSEGSVRADLIKSVKAARGRVVVTTFASNAARLQTLGEVARECGRKLCFAGRSLHRIIEAAQTNGYLKDMPPLVDMEAVDGLPRHEVMVVATGGQGEARAALARIAEGNHPVKLEEGDTVIFSSKQIPGNEIAIGIIMNKLAERNILTVTEKQAHVHVSGHPGQPELAALYDWIRPEVLIPVHGERRHMAEQARFALAHGVKNALVQSNGDVVRLAPGRPEIIGQERTGRLILDGETIIAADGGTINERRRLSWYGLIAVAVALDGDDSLLGEPQIRLHGVPIEEDREDFLEEASEAVKAAVRANKGDYDQLRESVRLAVRRVATSWTGKKPIVEVLIVETA